MEMTLPPEVERLARQAVERGRYGSIEEFLAAAARREAVSPEEAAANDARAGGPRSDRWRAELHAFVASLEPTNPAFRDDLDARYPDDE